MIKLYKVGPIYYIEANVSGARKRWSLRTRDRVVADALRRQTEMDLLGGARLRAKTWESFQEEFLGWIESQVRPKTLKGYRFLVNKFGAFLKDQAVIEVRDVSPETITRFTDARRRELHPSRKRTPTEGSIKFDLRILHRVFSYAIECEYISKNPVIARNRNAAAGKTLPFTQDEIKAMLADQEVQDKRYLRALILTFLHTGLRIGDVIDLHKSAIAENRLMVRTRKRNRDVALHVHDDLAEALKAHFESQNSEQRRSHLVFSTASGKPLRNTDKHLYRVFRRAKIHGGHAHRFRDTFAVRLLAKGGSLYDVAKLLGITVQTAELHYSPYVEELRQRGADLMKKLDFV